jgi:hypothetical protein
MAKMISQKSEYKASTPHRFDRSAFITLEYCCYSAVMVDKIDNISGRCPESDASGTVNVKPPHEKHLHQSFRPRCRPEEEKMKRLRKLSGIVAVVAVLGLMFSLPALAGNGAGPGDGTGTGTCDGSGGGGGNGPNGPGDGDGDGFGGGHGPNGPADGSCQG